MAKDYTHDERVIGAFLSNFRMVDVIKELKISKATAYKIRNDPAFQKVLRERKDAILQAAVEKMRGYMLQDTGILQDIIEDPETPAQTRVNAIQILMGQLREWLSTTDIIRRLEAIENRMPSGDGFMPF